MNEWFTYGSVRGAASDGGPYRDYSGVLPVLVRLLRVEVSRVKSSTITSTTSLSTSTSGLKLEHHTASFPFVLFHSDTNWLCPFSWP